MDTESLDSGIGKQTNNDERYEQKEHTDEHTCEFNVDDLWQNSCYEVLNNSASKHSRSKSEEGTEITKESSIENNKKLKRSSSEDNNILKSNETQSQILLYHNIDDEYGSLPPKRFDSNDLPESFKEKSPEITPKYDVQAIIKLRKEYEEVNKAKKNYKDVLTDALPNEDPIEIQPENPTGYTGETSPLKGWQRFEDKYYGETEVNLSPVRHNLGIIAPTLKDSSFKMFTWVLNVSESLYYDNTILLLSRCRHRCTYGSEAHSKCISDALQSNYTDITCETIQHWKNVIKLGQGAFGSVFRVQDSLTNQLLAVKLIKPTKDKSDIKHLSNFLVYIRERNSLIRASESPFLIQFLSSIKLPDVDGLFLVMEYCVTDLEKFILQLRRYRRNIPEFANVDSTKLQKLDDVHRKISIDIGYSIKEIMIVYAFELYCGLDYLARCDIVHRDIKPENILISMDLHMKIGDLGLVANKYYITNSSNNVLIKNSLALKIEAKNYKSKWAGSKLYVDPDAILDKIPQDYMADAYAMTLVILEIFTMAEPLFLRMADDVEFREVAFAGENASFHHFIKYMTEDDEVFNNYVVTQLTAIYNDQDLQKLAMLIVPLLRPRHERKTKYLTTRIARRFNVEYPSAFVNANKLKDFEPFSKLKLTQHNVLSYRFPLENFLNLNFDQTSSTTFVEVIRQQQNLIRDRQMLRIKPGLEFNLPT